MKKFILTLVFSCFLISLFSQVQIGDAINVETIGSTINLSVSLSSDGNRAAISSSSFTENQGNVQIYEENSGIWTQIGMDFEAEDPDNLLGVIALSSDGSRVAVVEVGYYTGLGASIKVYEENNGIWTQIGMDLEAEDPDYIIAGIAFSSDGSRVAFSEAEYDTVLHGRIKIYEENNGIWTQIGSDIEGNEPDGYFSLISLSSDGKRLTTKGQYGEASVFARMYEENNGIWTQIGLDIEGEDPDYSIAGIAFSSEGSRVAVSEVEYYTGLGARIKIYEENNGIWTQLGMDIEGEVPYDWFGFAFSLSGDGTMVAIGDPGTFFEPTERGYVRIYEENNGTWTQMGMDMEGENIGDYFGYSVSLSSDKTTVAVGTAVFNSDGEAAGHVRIFDLSLNPSAISDRKFNSDITLNVLPNPSLETFFIELSKDVKTLIVTDLNGKIIKSIPVLGATNHTINLIGVDSGIYLLRAISKHSTKVQQLIKL